MIKSKEISNILESGLNITYVFVIRHADRDSFGKLTDLGRARAEELIHVLGKSDIKDIYSRKIERLFETAKPLADSLGINIKIYDTNLKELANIIKTGRNNSLVVGHDDTIEKIINYLLGYKCARRIGTRFDDMHIVTIDPFGRNGVVSIKYGQKLK